jgi:hypothetical protein
MKHVARPDRRTTWRRSRPMRWLGLRTVRAETCDELVDKLGRSDLARRESPGVPVQSMVSTIIALSSWFSALVRYSAANASSTMAGLSDASGKSLTAAA